MECKLIESSDRDVVTDSTQLDSLVFEDDAESLPISILVPCQEESCSSSSSSHAHQVAGNDPRPQPGQREPGRHEKGRALTLTLNSEEREEKEEEDDKNQSERENSEGMDAYDAALIYEKEARVHEGLENDVKGAAKAWKQLEKDLGIPSVSIENPVSGSEGMCSVVLTIDVSKQSDMVRKFLELDGAVTVSVILDDIHKTEFRAHDRLPSVLSRINGDKPSTFLVGACLINAAKALIAGAFAQKKAASPARADSFFSLLYGELTERMRKITELCMVCGAKLYCGGVLPSICDGELCQYQYHELGLLNGLATPRVSAPVLSLLMMAFSAAAKSPRWKDILTAPSPRDRDRLVREAKALYKATNQEWSFVDGGAFDIHSVLGVAMPCAQTILSSPAAYGDFKKSSPSVAEFVEWLVITNKAYLELVPPALSCDYLQSTKQYLFVADSPAKQAQFNELVMANGGRTRFLFHGSYKENWHAIMRAGLKNMSGTHLQMVGARHGPGIYLSNHLSVSITYSTSFDERNVSLRCVDNGCCLSCASHGGGIKLLAVVEVIDSPTVWTHDDGYVVVVPDEKYCSIRLLAAYAGKRAPDVDLNKMSLDDKKKIQDAVHTFQTAELGERAKHA